MSYADLQPRPSPVRVAGGFLAVALILHLILLTLPGLRPASAPALGPRLEVRLREPAPQPELLPAPPPEPLPAQVPEPPPAIASETASRAPENQPRDPSTAAEKSPPTFQATPALSDPTPPSARRIRESLEDFDWSATNPGSRAPGRSLEGDLAEDWWRPVMSLEQGPLADGYLTGETEIVDRWLEPGGVHRVVVRGPDGRTYCGRQEPVNDFRPWEQMPMLFHRCAGGGKRR